ncbi:hypothetical protein BX600DRAFT_389544 [Xylariales sp. PMI_506]|nr:hypothetical protein BX600DRAFT_389544 [Xylariales sp. PMI_506]
MESETGGPLRRLEPRWNTAMIIASIAISLLGAFTATQLMCQARMSVRFSSVLMWALLGSLVFGFCSIWSLHEVAMLAYEFDLPIQVDASLTVLSAVLAVSFTFLAVSTDILWDRYWHVRKSRRSRRRSVDGKSWMDPNGHLRVSGDASRGQSSEPLLSLPARDSMFDDGHADGVSDDDIDEENVDTDGRLDSMQPTEAIAARHEGLAAFLDGMPSNNYSGVTSRHSGLATPFHPEGQGDVDPSLNLAEGTELRGRSSSEDTCLRRTSVAGDSSSGSFGISSMMGVRYNKAFQDKALSSPNVFISTSQIFRSGCNLINLAKGFLWSLAITSMHYVGIFALHIPEGYYAFNPWLAVLSALISWLVCTVGCILMVMMETHLPQQIIFSIIAAVGIGGMHFTGMAATTFWTTAPPSAERGYPPQLSNAVVGIAFMTCIIANVFLAHSATVSRNKLAEIVWTRKELWKTIALKETAEAAARARSEFIASASHEIRTPLHHLQGYSDLLAQTDLTSEGRALLIAIQRATKTLSLITNNVLDWSRFDQNAESSYRPTALDVRVVCESIYVLLPNLDEGCDVQLFVVVSPDVPKTIFLDETWLQRILMNLLSNALKFTHYGYIMLSISIQNNTDLIIVVSDTGCGLDPAFIPEMWTPFKQGEIKGSARGTGLGLSIIKQLLERMQGNISVDSKYEHEEGIGQENSGSTFTITIPIASPVSSPLTIAWEDESKPRIAIFGKTGQSRAMEGLMACWDKFGFEVVMANHVTELDGFKWKYVWAELDYLIDNPSQFQALLGDERFLVLVPMDTQDSLESLPGILNASNFIMIQRPLIWHTFEKRINRYLDHGNRHVANAPSRALRFAAEVEVLDGSKINKQPKEDWSKSKPVVLLVEDNPINQNLGEKMLTSLGYQVITAFDGQDGVDQLIKYDAIIDLLLMDHSMPRMDGVAATKEIRRLEVDGVLSRRRPIIAVTAVVNPEAQVYFKDAGADEFLSKPLALDRLKDTLSLYIPCS